jgi:nucleotide-binding universal stress UspA family protein
LAEVETSEYRRKFLVVVDESPECDRAITFAAYRVRRTGGTVVLLSVIEPIESQQWLGVEEVLKAEARDTAEALLDQRIARIARIGNIRTETVIREGRAPEAIEQLVAQDKAIAILVLAAARTGEGPGPLISAFATRSMGNALPVLITIVPAAMSDQDIIDVT